MYRAFFGLREQPFSLTPNPRFLYLNPSCREALSSLRYGVEHRKGFVSLIGEAGTGKTTLLRCLLAELGPEVRSVLVVNPAVGFEELLTYILTDLGCRPRPGTPKLGLLDLFNQELLATLKRGGNVVVLIDEAQDMSLAALEELRLLSNLETVHEKILQVVLAGQPELDTMLGRRELRQLRQRIAVPARLRPLTRPEVAEYVSARLETAGGEPAGLFTRPALLRLWRFSRGVPRLVNVACDNALVTAYAGASRRVGWRIMGTAIRDLHRGGLRAPRAARLRPVLVAAVAAAVAGVAIGVGSSHHAEQALGDLRTRPVREPAPDADRPPPAPRAPVEGGPVDEGARSAAAPVREAVGPVGPDRAAALAGKPESAPAPETMPATVVADAGTERDGDSGAAGRTAATEVVVEKGDNLTQIARRHYGYDSRPLLEEIRRMNPAIVDMDVIPAGRVILLPPDPLVHEAQAAPRPQGD